MSTYPGHRVPSPDPSHIPYYVHQASYVISYHDRHTCSRCTDKGCARLDEAANTLAVFRSERAARRQLRQR